MTPEERAAHLERRRVKLIARQHMEARERQQDMADYEERKRVSETAASPEDRQHLLDTLCREQEARRKNPVHVANGMQGAIACASSPLWKANVERRKVRQSKTAVARAELARLLKTLFLPYGRPAMQDRAVLCSDINQLANLHQIAAQMQAKGERLILTEEIMDQILWGPDRS